MKQRIFWCKILTFISFIPLQSSIWAQSSNPGIMDHADAIPYSTGKLQDNPWVSINRQNPNILSVTCFDLSKEATLTSKPEWNQGRFISINGGSSWTGSDILNANWPALSNVYNFNTGNVSISANGSIYITTAKDNSIYILKSADNGTTFSVLPAISTQGLSDNTCPRVAADDQPSSPFANNLYCVYYQPDATSGSGWISFVRSTNGGSSFSSVKTISARQEARRPIVQTGPNGEIYVTWVSNTSQDGFYFVQSIDGGNTFSQPIYVPVISSIESSLVNSNMNNIFTRNLISVSVDKSGKSHNGRIYITFATRENGNVNGKAIVQLVYSDDKGVTWSVPRTVSPSNVLQSWKPSVSVDQSNGNVFIVYSNIFSTDYKTNIYVAISFDGGNNFITQIANDVPFITQRFNNQDNEGGDWISIAVHNGKAFPVWYDNRNGKWQLYVSPIDVVPVIVGAPAFCSTAQYSVKNLPDYLSVSSWSSSPTGVVSINASGLATKLTQGNTTITATLNNGQTISYSITTIPQVASITSANYGCNTTTQSYLLTATPNMSGATNWQWTVDAATSGITLYSPGTQSTRADVSSSGGVSVKFTDACGEVSQRGGITIYNTCPRTFSVSPDPATSEITVSRKLSNNKIDNKVAITEINIFDLQGNLKKHRVFNKVNSANLNVADLPSGVFIIEIAEGNYKGRQLFQIKK